MNPSSEKTTAREPTVLCPKCGNRFALTKALAAPIEDALRAQFETQFEERQKADRVLLDERLASERTKAEKEAKIRAERAAAVELSKLRASVVAAQKATEATQADFERKLAAEKPRLARAAQKEAAESFGAKIANLQEQMEERDALLKQAQQREAALRKKEQSVTAKEKDIEKTVGRAVEAARKKATEEVTRELEKEYRTKELQHGKVVGDLRKQLGEAKRRLELSSQQSQGEVIELELEQVLAKTFPDDEIEPVVKGKRGADVIHRVFSPAGRHCGTIVWESKNTKTWSKSWLTKLRADQRRVKAEIAVLVSSALPSDMPSRLGQISGVWVTELSLVPGLAAALRVGLVEVAQVRGAAAGKTGKMELLYQYLTSTGFRQRVEAIVETFVSMKHDLDKERQTSEKNWAKREKHLELVLQSMAGMIGDLQAIAPVLPKVKRLELPGPR